MEGRESVNWAGTGWSIVSGTFHLIGNEGQGWGEAGGLLHYR